MHTHAQTYTPVRETESRYGYTRSCYVSVLVVSQQKERNLDCKDVYSKYTKVQGGNIGEYLKAHNDRVL